MSTPTITTKPRRVGRLVGVLALVAIAATWWVWFRPAALGGDTTLVTVSGTSMEPGMVTGDLAILRDTGDYAVGEVIAYRVPRQDGSRGGVVIHRIVGGDAETGFVLQGDNNDFKDPWRPHPTDIEGELLFHAPGAGRMVAELRNPTTAGALCAALAVFVILAGARNKNEESERGGKA